MAAFLRLEASIHTAPNGVWSPEKARRIVDQLTVRIEKPPPYLHGFLIAVGGLKPHHDFRPREIEKVEAAWEYGDEEGDECGFLVTLVDRRRFYLERRTTRLTPHTFITVHRPSALSPRLTARPLSACRLARAFASKA